MVLAGLFIPSEKLLTTLTTVLSVKWESSDSAAAGKCVPSILESLVESSLKGGRRGTNQGKVYTQRRE